jgi:predicted transcriptional regulator
VEPKTAREIVSELSDFIDDSVLSWLSQKPMSVKELEGALHGDPSRLRASLKRLLRAGKVRRFKRNRELIYSLAEGSREIGSGSA